jgi:regulator of RNase E activity RraA
MLHHALGLVRPGDFLVIDRCGDGRHACWGGVVTFNAAHAGVVGAVVDGRATDFEEVRRRAFPLWCAGPSPITTKILGLGGAMNVPVACGGVMVNPGDAILADECGILVLAPGEVDEVAEEALARQAREPDLLRRIEAGEKLGAISGATAKVTAGS